MTAKNKKKLASHSPKGRGRSSILQFLLTFAIIYLLTSIGLRAFFPDRFGNGNTEVTQQTVILTPQKRTTTMGRDFFITVHNRTGTGIVLANRCPEPPVIIERIVGEKEYQLDLSEPVIPCTAITELPAGSKTKIDLSPWKYVAFSEPGIYRLSLPLLEETVDVQIKVKSPGVFVSVFRAFISKPILNGLVLIASLIPNHSLGWSIVIITLIVKLALFFPSQHALQSQKKMQSIQPKLEEIKRKYKGDQQKITEETMALWKREKINPMQSCLPTLLQLPILLGLFFIIRDSSSIELARHLLYAPFLSLDWTFSTDFLGFLDLKAIPFQHIDSWFPPSPLAAIPGALAFPVTIAGLQFIQMRMMFAKKKAENVGKGKKEQKKPFAESMDPQTMMMYMLPIMLIFISGTLPAAVSMYWGASTLFSLGQQFVVNKK